MSGLHGIGAKTAEQAAAEMVLWATAPVAMDEMAEIVAEAKEREAKEEKPLASHADIGKLVEQKAKIKARWPERKGWWKREKRAARQGFLGRIVRQERRLRQKYDMWQKKKHDCVAMLKADAALDRLDEEILAAEGQIQWGCRRKHSDILREPEPRKRRRKGCKPPQDHMEEDKKVDSVEAGPKKRNKRASKAAPESASKAAPEEDESASKAAPEEDEKYSESSSEDSESSGNSDSDGSEDSKHSNDSTGLKKNLKKMKMRVDHLLPEKNPLAEEHPLAEPNLA